MIKTYVQEPRPKTMVRLISSLKKERFNGKNTFKSEPLQKQMYFEGFKPIDFCFCGIVEIEGIIYDIDMLTTKQPNKFSTMKTIKIILVTALLTALLYALQYVLPNFNLWLLVVLIGSFACLIFKTANNAN